MAGVQPARCPSDARLVDRAYARTDDCRRSSSVASRRSRTRELAGRARRVGGGDDLLAGQSPRRCEPAVAAGICARAAAPDRGSPACSSTPRSTRSSGSPTALGLLDDPAPRRRGAGVLRRGRAPHRRARDQGRAGRLAADIQALAPSTATSTCSTRAPRRVAGGTGETFDWSLPESGARARRCVLSGGLTPENVGEAIDAVAPCGRRRRQRRRGRARASRTPNAARVLRGGPRHGRPPRCRRRDPRRAPASSTASAATAASTSPRR